MPRRSDLFMAFEERVLYLVHDGLVDPRGSNLLATHDRRLLREVELAANLHRHIESNSQEFSDQLVFGGW